jgi:hypothetical protein
MLSKVRGFLRSISITPQVDHFYEIFSLLCWLFTLPLFTPKQGVILSINKLVLTLWKGLLAFHFLNKDIGSS